MSDPGAGPGPVPTGARGRSPPPPPRPGRSRPAPLPARPPSSPEPPGPGRRPRAGARLQRRRPAGTVRGGGMGRDGAPGPAPAPGAAPAAGRGLVSAAAPRRAPGAAEARRGAAPEPPVARRGGAAPASPARGLCPGGTGSGACARTPAVPVPLPAALGPRGRAGPPTPAGGDREAPGGLLGWGREPRRGGYAGCWGTLECCGAPKVTRKVGSADGLSGVLGTR